MKLIYVVPSVVFAVVLVSCNAVAQTPFAHPGTMHTRVDLDRMKAKVAAGEHPWIDSWTALCADPKAQVSYHDGAVADMSTRRQRASADAVAAYLLALRWYISGDTQFGDAAVRILNDWSRKQGPCKGTHDWGLTGIPIYEFAVAGELLRIYPGWKVEDFKRFKEMMENDLYPLSHDFLTGHAGANISHFWANWDLCNMCAILGIGVLCDDRAKFNEAIQYFKHGAGNGSIEHAVPFVYPGGLGQWQESGRDQEHAQLGVGMMGAFCQIAWNQGVDLFSYDNNRYLAGAEYVAAYNLCKPVPFTTYSNEDGVNNYWASNQNDGLRGRLQRPIWELVYNHYVVLKGLKAPNVTAMAQVYRPEGFEHDDNFGYGTLVYTLDASASPYPPASAPSMPQGLIATPGVGRVWLRWTPVGGANGVEVQRASTSGGPYTSVASYTSASPIFEDNKVTNGTAYYYRVAAKNQVGTGDYSKEVSATPIAAGAISLDWVQSDIGFCAEPGTCSYADVNGRTFIVSGSGSGLGGQTDGLSLISQKISGDFTMIARRLECGWGGGKARSGVMVRVSLDPAAEFFEMGSGDVGGREGKAGVRSRARANAQYMSGNAYTAGPTWFRITRVGDTFTGYQSVDGTTWFAVGEPSKVAMTGDILVGIFVSANSEKAIGATFDNVSILSGEKSK